MKWSSSNSPLSAALLLLLLSGAITIADGQRSKIPAASTTAQLALDLADFVQMPITGLPDGMGNKRWFTYGLAADRAGELYLLSKSDGVIRLVVGASDVH